MLDLSNIPVAVNKARYVSPYLTMGKYNIKSDHAPTNSGIQSSASSDSQVRLISAKSLYSYNKDYTKERAIYDAWVSQHVFNLNDIASGTSGGNHFLSMEELEKVLKKEGFSEEINWHRLNYDLWGLDGSSDNRVSDLEDGDLNKRTDYLASRYAVVSNRIDTYYQGVEKQEQFEKLDSLYSKTLEKLAGSYADILGDFLDNNGISHERDKIYDSIIQGMDLKINDYKNMLANNSDIAGIKGTEDEWLLNDDAYIAAKLREAAKFFPDANTAKTSTPAYTLADLDMLGQYAKALTKMEGKLYICQANEERLGFDFAVMYMKTDYAVNKGNISKPMNDLLRKTLENYKKACMDRIDEEFAATRKKRLTEWDEEGFAPLHRDTSEYIYQIMIDEYKRNKDILSALVKGATYAQKSYQKNLKGDCAQMYRYRNGINHWKNFFETDPNNKKPYKNSASTLSQYYSNWIQFEKGLSDGKFNFVTIKSSGAIENSDSINTNVVFDKKI